MTPFRMSDDSIAASGGNAPEGPGRGEPGDVVIVGAGRLGRSALRTLGNRVSAVVSGHPEVVRNIPADERTAIVGDIAELRDSAFDTLWLAVPDQSIRDVVVSLASIEGIEWEGRTVLHSSGANGLDVLSPIRARGAGIAVVHPNAILSGEEPFPERLVWGVTLDGPDRRWVESLLRAADPVVIAVDDRSRPLYHAAASLAANYSMTLFDAARSLYTASGVDSDLAGAIVGRFMKEAVRTSDEFGFREGLTGPVARGDIATVEGHLRAICAASPELTGLVVELVRTTVRLLGSERSDEWERMLLRVVRTVEGEVEE